MSGRDADETKVRPCPRCGTNSEIGPYYFKRRDFRCPECKRADWRARRKRGPRVVQRGKRCPTCGEPSHDLLWKIRRHDYRCFGCFTAYRRERSRWQYRRYGRGGRPRDPVKMAVYQMVRTALARGVLVRPNACSQCLKECRPEAHHHLGYDRPLDVAWLCDRCHTDAHRALPVEEPRG